MHTVTEIHVDTFMVEIDWLVVVVFPRVGNFTPDLTNGNLTVKYNK